MKLFKNRRALSPLIATLLLVVFALVIGTATMSWGKEYVQNLETLEEKTQISTTITIPTNNINTPLKEIQIKHLIGEYTEEQYYAEEANLKNKS